MVQKVNMRHSYLFYKANYPDPIDKSTYMKIVTGYMKFITDKMIDGFDINLGAKLGSVGIRGKKAIPFINEKGEIKGVGVAWYKTKQQWTKNAAELGMTFKEYVANVPKEERKLVYCFDEHSSNIRYRLSWFRRTSMILNSAFYILSFSRTVKRKMSQTINEGKEYAVIQPREKIVKTPRRRAIDKVRIEAIKDVPKRLEGPPGTKY